MASKYANRSCPVCVRPILPGDEFQNCDECQLSYHASCWKQNGGCNSEGCSNAPASADPRETLADTAEAEAIAQS